MLEGLTYFGMILAILVGVILVTAFLGWVSGDDDFILRWLFTCLLYSVTVTLLIMELLK